MAAERPIETMMRPPLGRAALLMFGLFAAPLAWAVQVVASYALAASSCFTRGVAEVGGAVGRVPLGAVAVFCAVVAFAGLVVALRQHRIARAALHDTARARHAQRSRALAMCGIFSSGLFLVAIAFSIVMLSLPPRCAG
ncbi:MAG TPA: hypothetical protein VGC30_04215 [Dokdonella sp.]